ncbi:MAG: DUF302 domain-containing protein [Sphingorhabdus sp.]
MTYYMATTLEVPFDDAVTLAEAALRTEGFGVLTRIDVAQTMKTKLDVDMPSYVILGACNPQLAYEALQLENKVGTMLPCNVVVRQTDNGKVEIAAIDPVASMQAIPNPQLKEAAAAVRDKLLRVIAQL